MVTVYITSVEAGIGKTTIGAGLGQHWLDEGKKIGFLKPAIADGSAADEDTAFMKGILGLAEPVELLCPVYSDESRLRSGTKEAYSRVSQGKDVVIIEGIATPGQSETGIVEALDAKVIVVAGYSSEPTKTINRCKEFGKHLLGVVVNKVPRSRMGRVQGEVSSQFSKAGINILGILPEDRTLLAISIGELARSIQGEVIRGAEKSGELLENFMLGALSVDPGPAYFGRKTNKAVLLKSERLDMQLAALTTPTRCLVLTGGIAPRAIVLNQAEEQHVPVVLAKDDTSTIAGKIETALVSQRFNQEQKLARLDEIMKQHFNFSGLSKSLGLTR